MTTQNDSSAFFANEARKENAEAARAHSARVADRQVIKPEIYAKHREVAELFYETYPPVRRHRGTLEELLASHFPINGEVELATIKLKHDLDDMGSLSRSHEAWKKIASDQSREIESLRKTIGELRGALENAKIHCPFGGKRIQEALNKSKAS